MEKPKTLTARLKRRVRAGKKTNPNNYFIYTPRLIKFSLPLLQDENKDVIDSFRCWILLIITSLYSVLQ